MFNTYDYDNEMYSNSDSISFLLNNLRLDCCKLNRELSGKIQLLESRNKRIRSLEAKIKEMSKIIDELNDKCEKQ